MYDVMWEDAGIIRDLDSLNRAKAGMLELEAELDETGVDASNLAYNLTWHDWMNMKNLMLVSQAVIAAAVAREDSRGAHFRADFPDIRDVENSRFTKVTLDGDQIVMDTEAVNFTRVKPGETLIQD
jgi:fumarate reductase flavoprotein subunit